MIQLRRRPGFSAKAFQVFVRRPLANPDNLQCHLAIQTFLPCPEHNGLAAVTNLTEQLVIAKILRQFQSWRAFFSLTLRIPVHMPMKIKNRLRLKPAIAGRAP
jgi:hypothetical protein